jgi:hypothetical protein
MEKKEKKDQKSAPRRLEEYQARKKAVLTKSVIRPEQQRRGK